MKQTVPKVIYTFVDPNTPGELQKVLKDIIIEKILTVKKSGLISGQ